MAHFAEIDDDNTVLRVVVVDDDIIRDADGRHNELLGQQHCTRILGGDWIQTSYNATFRIRFAGVGYNYNEELNAFLTPRPFYSWLLNEETYNWEPPVEMPDDGNRYIWNEVIMEWQVIEGGEE
jgi:hypothetical protein